MRPRGYRVVKTATRSRTPKWTTRSTTPESRDPRAPVAGLDHRGIRELGVLAFGVAACALWLLDPPRQPGYGVARRRRGFPRRRLGCSRNRWSPRSGTARGPIRIIRWAYCRCCPPSHDPSFPSDHATAAFAIAFGILFVARRTGWLFLAWAALIGISRVLAGMHYPTDVLAGAVVGLAAGTSRRASRCRCCGG